MSESTIYLAEELPFATRAFDVVRIHPTPSGCVAWLEAGGQVLISRIEDGVAKAAGPFPADDDAVDRYAAECARPHRSREAY